jgi:hypothetical protein
MIGSWPLLQQHFHPWHTRLLPITGPRVCDLFSWTDARLRGAISCRIRDFWQRPPTKIAILPFSLTTLSQWFPPWQPPWAIARQWQGREKSASETTNHPQQDHRRQPLPEGTQQHHPATVTPQPQSAYPSSQPPPATATLTKSIPPWPPPWVTECVQRGTGIGTTPVELMEH